jgi:DNA modification methylase
VQESLFADHAPASDTISSDWLLDQLNNFRWRGRSTKVTEHCSFGNDTIVPVFENEFWTSRQRVAHSLHEVSYRACFKAQLPAFFIERLTQRGSYVYDPFAGRGTTLIEAALLGRAVAGTDINPLSAALIIPRLSPPTNQQVFERLSSISLDDPGSMPEDLLAFYHPETLAEICALRQYLLDRLSSGAFDAIDNWIRMVAVNRLTGHSPGFLSVYTLPPNQAVSIAAQRKINADRNQVPPKRDVRRTIIRKSLALLADVDDVVRPLLARAAESARFRVASCIDTAWEPEFVQLVVTSPPFLDVVDYAADNWLRCWFCGIDAQSVAIDIHPTLDGWSTFIERAFVEFHRLLKPQGFVAFEVGEVRRGTVQLENLVVPRGEAAGLRPICIVVNEQAFTKTANIWGVTNNSKGTNSNRIVVFQKPAA